MPRVGPRPPRHVLPRPVPRPSPVLVVAHAPPRPSQFPAPSPPLPAPARDAPRSTPYVSPRPAPSSLDPPLAPPLDPTRAVPRPASHPSPFVLRAEGAGRPTGRAVASTPCPPPDPCLDALVRVPHTSDRRPAALGHPRPQGGSPRPPPPRAAPALLRLAAPGPPRPPAGDPPHEGPPARRPRRPSCPLAVPTRAFRPASSSRTRNPRRTSPPQDRASAARGSQAWAPAPRASPLSSETRPQDLCGGRGKRLRASGPPLGETKPQVADCTGNANSLTSLTSLERSPSHAPTTKNSWILA